MGPPEDGASGADVLPVLLAGGMNSRYGSPKALETIGGRTILDRALSVLAAAAGPAVIVANDPGPYEAAGLPIRPDIRPGNGVLGGILTAVLWAAERDCESALVLACDMPFVTPELLRRLMSEAGPAAVSIAASDGPRGVEPLCAVYGVGCAGAIEAALDRGDRAIISFFADVEVRRLPLTEVSSYGDPETLFFNVNRPEERQRAEELAGRASPAPREEV